MRIKLKKALQLIAIIVIGILMVATVVSFARNSAERVLANGYIPPPDGYPKLSLSTKVVTPTLEHTGENDLEYVITILNTGAYTAEQVTLADTIPLSTTYNGDAVASPASTFEFANGVLSWQGEVGFDASVVITFSVKVSPEYDGGILVNQATIDDPMIAEPVTVMAETRVTDDPIFEITKTSTPEIPGPNKQLTYELRVTNVGQDADGTAINVADFIPLNTTFIKASPGSSYNDLDKVVTWDLSSNLKTGETSVFTFSVLVGDVLSGTVLHNDTYSVQSEAGFGVGEAYTTTVIDPILILSKGISPDPPGGNSEVTYTLTVFNLGSMATDLVITDTVPAEVAYQEGGDAYDAASHTVTWYLDSLDTRQSAKVSFTGYIADIAGVITLNDDYAVCARGEDVCIPGIPVSSLIVGPAFDVTASFYPEIAHKPGGGTATVTPTLTIHNLGPGDALDATALLTFGNISVSNADVFKVTNSSGEPAGNPVSGPDCSIWSKCLYYVWTGNLLVGDVVTITTIEGQSTQGGDEWTPYTATIVVTDSFELNGYVTEPITATAIGHVTHQAHLIPTKSAPAQIGPGQSMTYSIQVFNSGLSTSVPPYPVLTEVLPADVTLVDGSISDGGKAQVIDGETVITWTLPAMSPGDFYPLDHSVSFQVVTDEDLVSGTLIVNDDYFTTWRKSGGSGTLSITGEPVTTTIHEVGLIDSYKEVTPTWALPGEGTVLTWTVHVVNSGPNNLTGVQVDDIFPWGHSTYQRDAQVSAGEIISDIVSLRWTGDVAPYSEQLITFTTVVDDFFEGVLTNTATITHTSLKQPLEVTAVAYITNKPVLQITKAATPNPVMIGGSLLYKIDVTNLGQQATLLTVTDTIPANTTYVFGSASSGGQEADNAVQWTLPVLNHGDTLHLTFQVVVNSGILVINDRYGVLCQEGVSASGEPVVTHVKTNVIFLPLVRKE
jgi:uncharacterized repeat protein (TIGR01451 family)